MRRFSFVLAMVGTALAGVLSANAQNAERCGNEIILKSLLAENPSYKTAYDKYVLESRKRADAYTEQINNSASKGTAFLGTIPVVFHIILRQSQIDAIGGINGIYQRASSQIDVLNEDFNARNPDTAGIPAGFKPFKGSMDIQFGFAHTKPDGTATDGIEIKVAPTTNTGFSSSTNGSDSAKKSSKGGLDPFDNTKYLNIWVVDITNPVGNGDVYGFAYSHDFAYSISPSFIDNAGVVLDYAAFGKRANILDYYAPGANKGRTLVHETGHFLGLWHIWGDIAPGPNGCGDDFISDTPPQKAATTQCKTYPYTDDCTTTGNGLMFMNFMDYPGDVCYKLFSKGQVAKMQSTLAPTGTAPQLLQHPELLMWPTSVASIQNDANLVIFPNPTTGSVELNYNVGKQLKEVRIMNITGQVVKQIATDATNNNVKIDLSNNPKGMYTIQCHFEDGVIVRKITLQ